MYEEVDKNIEKWSKIVYFVAVILWPICAILPNVFLSFYGYFTTDLVGKDTFVLLFPMWYVYYILMIQNHYLLNVIQRFPFTWNNPIGYLLATTMQYVMVTFVLYFVACSSTLAIAVYLFTMNATSDIIDNLHSINEEGKFDQKQSNLPKKIFEFIEYHSILKQLSHCDIEIDTKIIL